MNAVFMLIFENPVYMVGGCISACAHKQIIKKLGLNIDVNVMVDQKIYEYKNELLKFFDNVFLINLDKVKIHDKPINDANSERFSKWIGYSINKWQVLNYDDYNKILFVDVDFLPINNKFYNIFNYNTPCVLLDKKGNSEGGVIDRKYFDKYKYFKNGNTDWSNAISRLTGSINATLVLVKPKAGLYQEYLSFVKLCEGRYGVRDIHIDEKSLVLFLQFYKNVILFNIPYYYSVWFSYAPHKKDYYAINYPISIKSWIKPTFLLKSEEVIWPEIALKFLKKSDLIFKLYNDMIIAHTIDFFINYNIHLKQYSSGHLLYDKSVFADSDLSKSMIIMSDYVKYSLDKTNEDHICLLMNTISSIAKKINNEIEFNVSDLRSALVE